MVWARAFDATGEAAAVLETGEGYAFTAEAMVRAAEAIDGKTLAGAFTPAAAFGPDHALTIGGVERRDLGDEE